VARIGIHASRNRALRKRHACPKLSLFRCGCADLPQRQRAHALNLATGQEVPGSPVEIQASYAGSGPHNDGNGHVIFDPGAYKERPGLLLLNGTVYTAWASHCDIAPYTSWIIGYDEKTLAQTSVLNLDPNGAPNSTFLSDGSGNSFWGSGAGPAADATGNIYALSANGPFDTTLRTMDWSNYSAQQFDTSDGKTSYVLFSYTKQLSNTERTQIRITIRHPNPVQIFLLDLVTMSFINLPLVVWDNGRTAKANVVVTSHPQLLIVQ